MRFLSTTLLLSSVGVFTYGVIAAPLRITVVGKMPAPISPEDVEAFLRSVRLGHAAGVANENAAGSENEFHPGGRIALDEIAPDFMIESSSAQAKPALDTIPEPFPMTPDGEFDLPLVTSELVQEMNDAKEEAEVKAIELKAWLKEIFSTTPPPPDAAVSHMINTGCRFVKEGSFSVRVERIHDRVRDWFGLTPIERPPLCPTMAQNSKLSPTAFTEWRLTHVGPDMDGFAPGSSVPPRMPCHRGATRPVDTNGPRIWNTNHILPSYFNHRQRPSTFARRLQLALYSLSPWEGRAVAFVVGCGLGVLVRMIYVFAVLAVRMWRREQKQEAGEGRLCLVGDDEGDEIVGVVLFDAASIKGSASEEDLPSYQEKA